MWVVVGVLAVITIANVLLTAAVIRRLAAHERKFAALAPMLAAPGGLAPGEAVPAFLAESAGGERVDESHLFPGPAAVAFFSGTCDACLAHAPEFAALAADVPALAVLSGDNEALSRALGAVTTVREPEPGGALASAFRVDTFPTYFALEGGHVIAAAGSADELRGLLAMTSR